MRPRRLACILILGCLLPAASAQAVVLNVGGSGFGVALVPGASAPAAQAVTSAGPCTDPWLAGDLGGPSIGSGGLCWRGGPVVHASEMFDLTWDPLRRDWSSTRNYVESYLSNVAAGSGSTAGSNPLSSPYAVAAQYRDSSGRAANTNVYGGGCVDYGATGGSSCRFGDATGSAAGNSYPANGCPVSGTNQFAVGPNGPIYSAPNDVCLTDAQLKSEIAAEVAQQGLTGRTHGGYTPLVTIMTPPGVVDCLDDAGALCSANATVSAPKPDATAAATGGALPPGSYTVAISYVTAAGTGPAGPPLTVTVPSPPPPPSSSGTSGGGGSSTAPPPSGLITLAPPSSVAGAKGWIAFVTAAGGRDYYQLGSAGSPFPFGQPQPVSGPPSGSPTSLPTVSNAFCAYHSSVTVGGVQIPYVVQPWTALTECDDPSAPSISSGPDPETLAIDIGARLVSPISQATLGALTDPFLNGWASLSGGEINDNGCTPLPNGLDNVAVGGSSYLLQRAFNNGGVVVSDPNAPRCAGSVNLVPRFVVPSSVDPGDVVEFDGTKTVSTLVVPRAGYVWSFGDGTSAIGPSVVHTYAKGGPYTVALTVTDRGGNVRTLSQPITVLGALPVVPPPPSLRASLALVPQSLRSVLRTGLVVRITSNRTADGLTSLAIPRQLARQAHLHAGSGPSVVVGRGTLSGIRAGTQTLHLRLSRTMDRMLAKLHHMTVTLRVTLIGAQRLRTTVDAAGRY